MRPALSGVEEMHLRREISASSAPSVPRSLRIKSVAPLLIRTSGASPYGSISRQQCLFGMSDSPYGALYCAFASDLILPSSFCVWMKEDYRANNPNPIPSQQTYLQCTCVSINPGKTVLSRRSIISSVDAFEGSKEASWWISDCVVGAMERILPLIRDISIV